MATETRVVFIRHVETEWNVEKRTQGHLDSPLTPNGVLQARALTERMSRFPFDTLYSSDLERTYQTALYIANRTGHQIIQVPCLRERKYGVRQGLTSTEFAARYPEVYQAFLSGDPDYQIPEGESLREFYHRCVNCFGELMKKHQPGEIIVIVTHGGFLDNILRYVLNIPLASLKKFERLNASFNEFILLNGDWTLMTWGDISHLQVEPLDGIE